MNYLTDVTVRILIVRCRFTLGETHTTLLLVVLHLFFLAPSLYLLSNFRFFLVFTSGFHGQTYKEHCNTNKAAAVARGGGEVDT